MNPKDWQWLFSLKVSNLAKILFVIASTLIPGILIIYHFKNKDFYTLSSFKLILLAVAITVPIFMVNMLISTLQEDIWVGDKEERVQFMFFTSGLITSCNVYMAFVTSYFRNYNFKAFLTQVVVIEVVYAIILGINFVVQNSKRKKELLHPLNYLSQYSECSFDILVLN